jgi:hypothetical protein
MRPRTILSALAVVLLASPYASARKPKNKKPTPAASQPQPEPAAAQTTPAPAPVPAPAPAPPPAASAPPPATPEPPPTAAASPTEPDAKPTAEAKFAFEIAPAFVLPVGNLADAASVGVGALVGMRRNVAKQLDITARAGFVYHFSKEAGGGSVGISELPFLAGVRYTFVPTADGGFYGGGEVGMSILFARAAINDNALVGPQSTTKSEAKASTALGLGYQFGRFDAKGSLYVIDVGHPGDSMTIMASLGYAFVEL